MLAVAPTHLSLPWSSAT